MLCMAGGLCITGGRGAHAWQGVYMVVGGMRAGETATEADGTHLTGMHSC